MALKAALAPSIRDCVWAGKLPVCIMLSEPMALKSQSYLLYASRLCYLPLYTTRILSYFARYIETASKLLEATEWWFEFEGKPIPWNRPIGLLYDTLVGLPTGRMWTIELKSGKYPSDQILKLDSNDTLHAYWTNQFKESSYIRDGNARAVMLMPREEQEALWNVVVSLSFSDGEKSDSNEFWQYAEPLIRKPSLTWNVPIRLYPVGSDQPVVQKLVSASETLGNFLMEALNLKVTESEMNVTRPILHGVIVPLSAPLGELYSECMYMDGFLHIAV